MDCIKGRHKRTVLENPRVNTVGSAYPEGLNGKQITHILTSGIAADLESHSSNFSSEQKGLEESYKATVFI